MHLEEGEILMIMIFLEKYKNLEQIFFFEELNKFIVNNFSFPFLHKYKTLLTNPHLIV